jgi:hypothetical protein
MLHFGVVCSLLCVLTDIWIWAVLVSLSWRHLVMVDRKRKKQTVLDLDACVLDCLHFCFF